MLKISKLNQIYYFRLGEPVWTEIWRSIVRFVLFVILITYLAYSIFRAINSPIINQEKNIDKNQMPFPGL
jgi:hypothetical protein